MQVPEVLGAIPIGHIHLFPLLVTIYGWKHWLQKLTSEQNWQLKILHG